MLPLTLAGLLQILVVTGTESGEEGTKGGSLSVQSEFGSTVGAPSTESSLALSTVKERSMCKVFFTVRGNLSELP